MAEHNCCNCGECECGECETEEDIISSIYVEITAIRNLLIKNKIISEKDLEKEYNEVVDEINKRLASQKVENSTLLNKKLLD